MGVATFTLSTPVAYCRFNADVWSILRHTLGGLMIRVSVPDDDEQRVYLLPSGGGGQRSADCIHRSNRTDETDEIILLNRR